MKQILIEREFLNILKEIQSEKRSIIEWREIESSDMFQSENYCGGFDSIEDKFTFSYNSNNNVEFWFELTIEQIDKILIGEINKLELKNQNKSI